MSRNTLHKNKEQEFKTWLVDEGWSLEPTKGDYEVIRARKGQILVLIYSNHESDHLSYSEKFNGIVRKFINSRKR